MFEDKKLDKGFETREEFFDNYHDVLVASFLFTACYDEFQVEAFLNKSREEQRAIIEQLAEEDTLAACVTQYKMLKTGQYDE